MKNLSLIASAIVVLLVLLSCSKTELVDKGSFTNEIANEEVQIVLPEANYTTNFNHLPSVSDDGDYTKGILTYIKNGTTLAVVDFGSGIDDKEATIKKDGKNKICYLKKDKSKYKGKDSKYKKVIIEPLVKTGDCGYITSGYIKYYELKSGEWTATIDYGNGTCDDKAVKTTKEGNYTFSLDDWK